MAFQLRRLPLQPLLAPIDDHAADRGIGTHHQLGIVVAPRAHHLVAVLFDLANDVMEALALQVAGLVEAGGAEQELEAARIFHADSPGSRPGAGSAAMPRPADRFNGSDMTVPRCSRLRSIRN